MSRTAIVEYRRESSGRRQAPTQTFQLDLKSSLEKRLAVLRANRAATFVAPSSPDKSKQIATT